MDGCAAAAVCLEPDQGILRRVLCTQLRIACARLSLFSGQARSTYNR